MDKERRKLARQDAVNTLELTKGLTPYQRENASNSLKTMEELAHWVIELTAERPHPTSGDLIEAIKTGKHLEYRQDKNHPDRLMSIEPYRYEDVSTVWQYKLYGWGSAVQNPEFVAHLIIAHPERFLIIEP